MRTDTTTSRFTCDQCGAVDTINLDDEEAGILPRGWYRLYPCDCTTGLDHCGTKCLAEYAAQLESPT